MRKHQVKRRIYVKWICKLRQVGNNQQHSSMHLGQKMGHKNTKPPTENTDTMWRKPPAWRMPLHARFSVRRLWPMASDGGSTRRSSRRALNHHQPPSKIRGYPPVVKHGCWMLLGDPRTTNHLWDKHQLGSASCWTVHIVSGSCTQRFWGHHGHPDSLSISFQHLQTSFNQFGNDRTQELPWPEMWQPGYVDLRQNHSKPGVIKSGCWWSKRVRYF